MRMQVQFSARLETWDAEAEGDHFGLIVRSEYLAANFAGYDEEPARQEFDVFKPPDLLLEPDSVGEFINLRQGANVNRRFIRHSCSST